MISPQRRRRLDEAARLLRRFRQLPASEQARQVRELLREQGARRRAAGNNASLSGTLNFLKNGRDVPFPVGKTRDGKTIWRSEDSHALASWLVRSETNPWTRERVNKSTRNAVFRKALATRHIGNALSENAIRYMERNLRSPTRTPPSAPRARRQRRRTNTATPRRGGTTRRRLSDTFDRL